jgi:Zn-dependent protease with chaperone function
LKISIARMTAREAPVWKNMSALGGKKQPAFLSDHPSNENRIKDLQGAMPKAMQQMAAANAQGRTPNCR